MARKPTPIAPRDGSKLALAVKTLKKGSTIDNLAEVLEYNAHSTRAVVSNLQTKYNYTIEAFEGKKGTVYKVA